MAKKKEQAKAAPKKSNINYIIGAIVVIVILFLIFRMGREAPEAAPEAPAAPEAAEKVVPPEKIVAEETIGHEAVTLVTNLGKIEAIEEETSTTFIKNVGESNEFVKEVAFSDVNCYINEEYDPTTTVSNVGKISFKVTNMDDGTYELGLVRALEAKDKPASRISLNGRRFYEAPEKCGAEQIKGGETITCSDLNAFFRSGKTNTGAEQYNRLKIETSNYISVLSFKCNVG